MIVKGYQSFFHPIFFDHLDSIRRCGRQIRLLYNNMNQTENNCVLLVEGASSRVGILCPGTG